MPARVTPDFGFKIRKPVCFEWWQTNVRKRLLTVLILALLLCGTEALSTCRAEEASSTKPSDHWAFKPLSEPSSDLPSTSKRSGKLSANPVDRFILAKLQDKGITAVPPADKPSLLRRVTFDLTGLPPTPRELREFLSDRSPQAYERVVDRLLGSPAFGERWAQHWLDLAHYADSNGFELDADRLDAWRYRDWVVKAINQDLPYDQFVMMQVAGDEHQPGDVDALIASGFARSGPFEIVGGNIDPEVKRQNELTAATTTVGSVFLGLTVGCARCHDHKFDPIPTADYYRLESFFAGAKHVEVPIHAVAEKEAFEKETARIRALIKPFEQAKTQLEEPYRKRLAEAKEAALTAREREIRAIPKEKRTSEEARLFEGVNAALRVTWEEVAESVAHVPADHTAREKLKREIHELEIQLPRPPGLAMAMVEGTNAPPETRILRRGDVKSKRESVAPVPPAVLNQIMASKNAFDRPISPLDSTRSGRRLALARWLTARDNPLTPRVMVNRLWQHHFGQGLVATPSDFGAKGSAPTHPELLDWLAGELLRQEWKLKPLHRLMVTSEAYRRSSIAPVPDVLVKDPDNRLLGWRTPRRMEGEALRDSALAVAGILNSKPGGPGVRIPLEPEVVDLIFTEAEVVSLWPEEPDPREQARRSIYLHRKRNVHYPLLDAFDAPDMLTSCPRRPVSTHAPQALVLLNSGFAQQTARAFARSLMQQTRDPAARLKEAYLRCYARPPSAADRRLGLEFIRAASGSEEDRWTDLALALINSNEFVYVP